MGAHSCLYLSFYLSFSLSPSLSLLSIILFCVSNGRFRPCYLNTLNWSCTFIISIFSYFIFVLLDLLLYLYFAGCSPVSSIIWIRYYDWINDKMLLVGYNFIYQSGSKNLINQSQRLKEMGVKVAYWINFNIAIAILNFSLLLPL